MDNFAREDAVGKNSKKNFIKYRRSHVLVAIGISFPAWYFGAGRDLAGALLVTAMVALGRWILITRNLI